MKLTGSIILICISLSTMATKQEEFLQKYGRYAYAQSLFHKVPASITLAQAILESGWGSSELTKNANNFFGIKAHDWNGEVYEIITDEYKNGVYVQEVDAFRKYRTPLGSFKDHVKFLKENSMYQDLFKISKFDYEGWANGLQEAGYATSPTYASKLISLIEQYDLAKYDRRAAATKIGVTITSLVAIIILYWAIKNKYFA